jgi:hypothetical protein
MLIYSTILRPAFWIIMGLLYALTFAGAPLWFQDFGFQMTWWKWILAALWYAMLCFTLAGSFTLLGEKEPGAWYKFLGFHLVMVIILGVVFWFIF